MIYSLKLYVAGDDAVSRRAITDFNRLALEALDGEAETEIVDVMRSPESAREFDVAATPMLIKTKPGPVRKVVGDLSETDAVMFGLGLLDRRRTTARAGH